MTIEQLAGGLGIALPEIWLALFGMGLLMVGVFRQGRPGAARQLAHAALAGLILTLALVVNSFPGETSSAFSDGFVVDQFGVFMKALVLVAAGLTLIMGLDHLESARSLRFEYPVLVVFATLGMLMMVSANDLMSLYVGLELQSLALYVLASFERDNAKATEAGLKYFVLGALSSGMLLYGASLIYGFAGATTFAGIAKALAGSAMPVGVVVGLVFVLAGLCFKISAVPFHMWTPDVYEGAPTPVTAFFAAAPKMAAIALLTRVVIGPFGDHVASWQLIIELVAIGSMGLGAFAAISQTNIKRLLAYSSIGNVGFALVGLAAGTVKGVSGLAIYMAIYLAMTVGAFACVLAMRRDGKPVEQISDLAGLSRRDPRMALILAVFMFSMAGIPPLAGFFSKLYVFLAAIEQGLVTLAVLGVLASVVGAFYYLRIVKIMYFDEPAPAFDAAPGIELQGVMVVTGAATALFFVWPAPLIAAADAAARALVGG